MSAEIAPVFLRLLEPAIDVHFRNTGIEQLGALIGRHNSNVSRLITAVADGETTYLDRLDAKQLLACLSGSDQILGALIAASATQRNPDHDQHPVASSLRPLLRAAHEAAEAIHPDGPGGVEITREERLQLLQTFRPLLVALAAVVLDLSGGR